MQETTGDTPDRSGAPETPELLRARRVRILEAREARAALVRRLCEATPRPAPESARPGDLPAGWCLILAGTSVPGADKEPGGLEAAFDRALRIMGSDPDVMGQAGVPGFQPRLLGGHDALGPFQAWAVPGDPVAIKRTLVRLEESAGWGRLLDLDLYTPDGRPIGRTELGHPPRRCLACDEAAVDCMRAGRHDETELRNRTERLLAEFRFDT